jgi:hypothetical protein
MCIQCAIECAKCPMTRQVAPRETHNMDLGRFAYTCYNNFLVQAPRSLLP